MCLIPAAMAAFFVTISNRSRSIRSIRKTNGWNMNLEPISVQTLQVRRTALTSCNSRFENTFVHSSWGIFGGLCLDVRSWETLMFEATPGVQLQNRPGQGAICWVEMSQIDAATYWNNLLLAAIWSISLVALSFVTIFEVLLENENYWCCIRERVRKSALYVSKWSYLGEFLTKGSVFNKTAIF